MAFADGVIVAVTVERWSAPENVTVRESAAVCDVEVLKPRPEIAEIRHTPRLPYRTVTLPPCEGTVCRPGPPSWQSTAGGFGAVVRPAVEEVLVGVEAEGDGRSVAEGGTLAEGLGGGSLGEGLGGGSHAGGESMTVGADRATGGVRLVEPTTN